VIIVLRSVYWIGLFFGTQALPKNRTYVDTQICPKQRAMSNRWYCWQLKMFILYNGLHHCIPLVEMVKKYIWNVQFGVRMRELCLRENVWTTGSTGTRRYDADMNYRYYRSETGTTDGWW
jgi:hypothetical protein